MPKQPKSKKQKQPNEPQMLSEKKRQEMADQEAKQDAKVATRTARYDQDIKERARKLAINPDNFATETELKQAVLKAEGKLEDE